MSDFNAQNQSNSMWAAAKLGIEDKAFTTTWLRETKLELPDFNAQELLDNMFDRFWALKSGSFSLAALS